MQRVICHFQGRRAFTSLWHHYFGGHCLRSLGTSVLSKIHMIKQLEPQCRSKQWQIFSQNKKAPKLNCDRIGSVEGKETKNRGWGMWLSVAGRRKGYGRALGKNKEKKQVNSTIQIRNPQGKIQYPKQSQKTSKYEHDCWAKHKKPRRFTTSNSTTNWQRMVRRTRLYAAVI